MEELIRNSNDIISVTIPTRVEAKKEWKIGNYTIGKSIGEGTFGKVRIGVHEPTQEKVRYFA